MVKNNVIVLVIMVLSCALLQVNSKIIVKLKNLECFPNKDWLNMSCNLKAINWRKSLVNIDAELKQDWKKMMIHGQVFKRYNSYQPFPLKFSFEFCSLLKGSGSNYFFSSFLHELVNKFSNFNHTCPYRKSEKIIVKNLDWQPLDFININIGAAGAGRYRLDINVYVNGAKTKAALIVGHSDIGEDNH